VDWWYGTKKSDVQNSELQHPSEVRAREEHSRENKKKTPTRPWCSTLRRPGTCVLVPQHTKDGRLLKRDVLKTSRLGGKKGKTGKSGPEVGKSKKKRSNRGKTRKKKQRRSPAGNWLLPGERTRGAGTNKDEGRAFKQSGKTKRRQRTKKKRGQNEKPLATKSGVSLCPSV